MSKILAATMPDGSVDVTAPNPFTVKALQTGGFFGPQPSPELLEREIDKFLRPNGDGSPSRVSADLARRWITALAEGGLTEAQALALIAEMALPNAAEVHAVSALPSDRSFRQAWTLAEGSVVVDMRKARQLQMARLRAARNAKLQALDVDQARFIGAKLAGSSPEWDAAEAKKQVLRDLPETVAPLMEAAADPDALIAVYKTLE